MIFFHLSDLHLGKRVYDFSMIEDQKFILDQVLRHVEEERPEGIFISGDVYDKPVPPVEAVKLLDSFLTSLVKLKIKVFMIGGNHDSAQRLDYANNLLLENEIYISGGYEGKLLVASLEDKFGKVNIYLLPFVKPGMVRPFFQEEIDSYEQAISLILQKEPLNLSERNILLAHQFVTWRGEAQQSDSETGSLGGVDAIDAQLFFDFDYVALGHLHSPQRIGRDTIRFAGSPLAYSFSEIRHKKSITKVALSEKGTVDLSFLPLTPMRPLREIKGTLEQLLEAGHLDGGSQDYMRAILTNQETVYDPMGQLRRLYPNMMTLEMEKQKKGFDQGHVVAAQNTDPRELFSVFFERQNDKEMDEIQKKQVEKIWSLLEEEGL